MYPPCTSGLFIFPCHRSPRGGGGTHLISTRGVPLSTLRHYQFNFLGGIPTGLKIHKENISEHMCTYAF